MKFVQKGHFKSKTEKKRTFVFAHGRYLLYWNFQHGARGTKDILMSLAFLVAEKTIQRKKLLLNSYKNYIFQHYIDQGMSHISIFARNAS